MHGGAAREEQRAQKERERERAGERGHFGAVVRVWFEGDVGRMLLTIMRRRATYRARGVRRHS